MRIIAIYLTSLNNKSLNNKSFHFLDSDLCAFFTTDRRHIDNFKVHNDSTAAIFAEIDTENYMVVSESEWRSLLEKRSSRVLDKQDYINRGYKGIKFIDEDRYCHLLVFNKNDITVLLNKNLKQ